METAWGNLLQREVERLFLVVWPPLGESNPANLDISIGFVFRNSPGTLLVVSTSKEDNWSPVLYKMSLPSKMYSWSDFSSRIAKWRGQLIEDAIDNEFYEATTAAEFKEIVQHKIMQVELIKAGDSSPLGVKICFENDFVQSTPLADGNTIETSQFNRNDNLQYFSRIGGIISYPIG